MDIHDEARCWNHRHTLTVALRRGWWWHDNIVTSVNTLNESICTSRKYCIICILLNLDLYRLWKFYCNLIPWYWFQPHLPENRKSFTISLIGGTAITLCTWLKGLDMLWAPFKGRLKLFSSFYSGTERWWCAFGDNFRRGKYNVSYKDIFLGNVSD